MIELNKELIDLAYLRDARRALFEMSLYRHIPFTCYTLMCDKAILKKNLEEAEYWHDKMCEV